MTKKTSGKHLKHPVIKTHGVYSAMTILRGEDAEEYERLVSDLFKEWTPIGPSEEEAVITVAQCYWRKRRYQNALYSKMALSALDQNHPAYDPYLAPKSSFLASLTILEATPQRADPCLAICPDDMRAYFEKKYPRIGY